MRLIARRGLREFAEKHADSKSALDAWWLFASKADWEKPQDVKDDLAHASIVAGNRVVFNICGGSYRLVVKFNYPYRIGYIRWIGNHADYDRIDVTTI